MAGACSTSTGDTYSSLISDTIFPIGFTTFYLICYSVQTCFKEKPEGSPVNVVFKDTVR